MMRRGVKPYRPALVTNPPLKHRARWVGAYRLPLEVEAADLRRHFGRFGTVRGVTMHYEPTSVWAEVEFETDAAAREAVRGTLQRVGPHPVLVLRLHDRELPARPFPGMDAASNPLRQALLEHVAACS